MKSTFKYDSNIRQNLVKPKFLLKSVSTSDSKQKNESKKAPSDSNQKNENKKPPSDSKQKTEEKVAPSPDTKQKTEKKVVTLDSKLKNENKQLISEIFSQWRDSLSKDSFTDLKILCKDDWYGGVSLHKAVLASISPFMASILSDGRDETTLLLPDIDRYDLLNLVKILYGGKHDNQTPTDELLHMLGIKELPKVIPSASTTNITSEYSLRIIL